MELRLKLEFGIGLQSAVEEVQYVSARIKEIFPDATEEQTGKVANMLTDMFMAHVTKVEE
jgi:hypothetical protein